MAIRDLAHKLLSQLAFSATISSDTTTFGASLDTANFDGGYVLTANASTYTDGTYVITLQDSPDNSVWTDVAAEKLLFPVDGSGNITITGNVIAGSILERLGAFSTNRFVRAKIVSSSTTSGAFIGIIALKVSENTPV